MFKGHAKADIPDYEIDLLAPADDVIAALAWLRENHDCSMLTNVQINSKYSALINRAVAKLTKLNNAHMLRGLNAVACHKLWGKSKSMIGYMRHQLGHSHEGTTAGYSAWNVRVTKAWGAGAGEQKVETKGPPAELKSYSRPSKTKAAEILEIMLEGQAVTVKSVIKCYGGKPALVHNLLDMNATVIAAHNEILAEAK